MSKRNKLAGAVLLWTALSIGTVHADGARTPRPDPYAYSPGAVDYNWSGLFAGGHAGASHTALDWTFTGPTETFDQGQTAFAGGVQIGLQKQWSRMIIGAEVSYTWIDMSETTNSILAPGTSRIAEVSNLLLATGRLGVTQDNMMAYAKAGYATADVDFRSTVTGTGVVTNSSSGREHGWVAGLGMDYGLTPHVTIGIEYNYIHLNVDGRDQNATPAGLPGSRVAGADVDMQTVMARLNFKFGPRAEVLPLK